MVGLAPIGRSPMLAGGARIGPYRILDLLGSGGMGEVYRAHDPRLGRDVALKILVRGPVDDPDLAQRFEREARAASVLDHPNVVAVHDVGVHDGVPFLVMELLEGETLRTRLDGGRVPLRRALEIGSQVALGLAAAHARGIVHCDLKPENLFVTRDGIVKILDFGIARLRRSEPLALPPGAASPMPGGSDVAFGTLGYAAPEVLRGQAVDASADLFSLGAILYEMVAHARPFPGPSPYECADQTLNVDPPPLAYVNDGVPERLVEIVRRCLAKSTDDRMQSAHDLMLELRSLLEPDALAAPAPAPRRGLRRQARRWLARRARTWPAWMVAVAALGGCAALAWMLWSPRLPWARVPLSLELAPPPGTRFALEDLQGPVTLSPDGRRAAFVAIEPGGRQRLWVRDLRADRAWALPGTEGAHLPFWSPDGRSLGFFAYDRLRRVDLDGRRPVALCATTYGRGGAWERSGSILFATAEGPIRRVPANGGAPEPVTRVDTASGEYGHRFPQVLPGGRLLYFVRVAHPDPQDPRGPLVVQRLDGRDRRVILRSSSSAIYASGRLLYLEGGSLMARGFDPRRARFTGPARRLADGVSVLRGLQAPVSASSRGALAYHPAPEARWRLVWMDRLGNPRDTLAGFGTFDHWSLSADGRSVAAALLDSAGGIALWRFDAGAAEPRRLTFDDEGLVTSARWTPDGRNVVHASNRSGTWDLYRLDPRTGRGEPLLADARDKFPTGVSPDGRYVGYVVRKVTDWDLWVLPLDGSSPPFPYATGETTEADLAISPDGRWAAYTMVVGHREEVFVAEFPRLAARRQVSGAGGDRPAWRADGRELAYVDADGWIVTTPVSETPEGLRLQPERTRVTSTGGFAMSRDGSRFLVAVPDLDRTPRAVVVHDWTAMLRAGR